MDPLNRGLLALTLVSGLAWSLPSTAQALRAGPAPLLGPTSILSVPRAYVRPVGNNLVNSTLYLGTPGTPAGALGLSAEMGLSPGVQLDMGITALAVVPWSGALSLAGKWGLLQEGITAPVSISGLAGGLLSINANGQPTVGLMLGLPLSKTLAFNRVNSLGLTLQPAWNVGAIQPYGFVPGGSWPVPNLFSVGVGADLGLTPALHLLADTSVGIPGVTGVSTQSNFGVRFAFNPRTTFDLFVGTSTNTGLNLIPSALGLSGHWQY